MFLFVGVSLFFTDGFSIDFLEGLTYGIFSLALTFLLLIPSIVATRVNAAVVNVDYARALVGSRKTS